MKHYILNDRIRAKEVRLIGNTGEQLGVLPLDDAKRLSTEKNLDLLLISGDANPPVCKLVDYGQFMYQQKKKEKQQRRSVQVIKELKMSHKISIHDYNVRLTQAEKFLKKKNKVKLTITFKGREIVYRDTLGNKLADKFLADIEEHGIKDNDVVRSGRSLTVLINPK